MVSTGLYCIGIIFLWEIDGFEIVRLLWDSESIVKLYDGYEKVIYLNIWIYMWDILNEVLLCLLSIKFCEVRIK